MIDSGSTPRGLLPLWLSVLVEGDFSGLLFLVGAAVAIHETGIDDRGQTEAVHACCDHLF